MSRKLLPSILFGTVLALIAWAVYFLFSEDIEGLDRLGSTNLVEFPATREQGASWMSSSGQRAASAQVPPFSDQPPPAAPEQRPREGRGAETAPDGVAPLVDGESTRARAGPTERSVRSKTSPTDTPAAARDVPAQAGSAGPLNATAAAAFDVSGQVVTEQGQPAPRIEVTAALTRLFDPPEGSGHPGAEVREWSALTDAAGAFRLRGLFNGEYNVRTRETYLFPESANVTVRAGADDVKLVVVEQRDVWVDGYVADAQGKAVKEVRIFPGGATEPVTLSDAGGGFSFLLTVRSDRPEVITLRAEGYREQRLSISRNDWFDRQQVELNIVMQPEQTLTSVSGLVQSSAGRPLVGEQVYLQRAQQKYRATTDESGGFLMNEVESGGGYALWLVPRTGYRDFRQEGIKVPSTGLSGLSIVLEPLGVGRLSGRLLDTAGSPVPNFTLLIRSGAASAPVTSNGAGFFAIDNVPEGAIRIETSSFPRLITSGILLPAGGEVEVSAILDLGNQQVSGRVIDERGTPVAGADVTLSWVQRNPPLLHESLRKSLSTADGGFLFSRLGAVPHKIIVQAPGFERAEHEPAAGGRVDVRLVPQTR